MNGQDKIYQMITDRILKSLDNGTVPWHKPWSGGAAGQPINAGSGHAYRGINVWLLTMAAVNSGHTAPLWLTFKQANKLGGKVKKGEHGEVVVFWKWIDMKCSRCTNGRKEDGSRCSCTNGKVKVPFLRYYKVFNLDQTEGVKLPKKMQKVLDDCTAEPKTNGRIEKCEKIVNDWDNNKGSKISEDGNGRAFYRPTTDSIHLPKLDTFNGSEEYYSTTFHEMIHATGHKSRLSRDTLQDAGFFGDTNYSKEEMVAEFGAAFLCGMTGIDNKTVDNSAAYINGWSKKIQKDRKLVVHAAAQAQKAVDFVLGRTYDNDK